MVISRSHQDNFKLQIKVGLFLSKVYTLDSKENQVINLTNDFKSNEILDNIDDRITLNDD